MLPIKHLYKWILATALICGGFSCAYANIDLNYCVYNRSGVPIGVQTTVWKNFGGSGINTMVPNGNTSPVCGGLSIDEHAGNYAWYSDQAVITGLDGSKVWFTQAGSKESVPVSNYLSMFGVSGGSGEKYINMQVGVAGMAADATAESSIDLSEAPSPGGQYSFHEYYNLVIYGAGPGDNFTFYIYVFPNIAWPTSDITTTNWVP